MTDATFSDGLHRRPTASRTPAVHAGLVLALVLIVIAQGTATEHDLPKWYGNVALHDGR